MFLGIIHFLQHICLKLFYECQELLPFYNWKGKGSRSVVSNSLWPHGLQFTRLLHLWDFPGKSTGVGCHFLLQGIFPTQESNPVSCIIGRRFTVWATREVCYGCIAFKCIHVTHVYLYIYSCIVCLFTLLLIDYGYYEQICYKYLFINRLCPKAVFIFLFDK